MNNSKMSTYLQFMPNAMGSGLSTVAQSVGIQTPANRVHERNVQRHQTLLNMMKFKMKKRGM